MYNRQKVSPFIIALLILAYSSSGWSQYISRVATCAGQFLLLGVGARATAMGGAGVTLDGDVAALYWNPSGVASINRVSLMFSHTDLYSGLGIFHKFMGVVVPTGSGSAVGLGVVHLSTDDIEVTTIDDPEGAGVYYTVEDYSIGISYARFVTDRLTLGITLKFIHEGIYREQAQTLAADFGSTLNTGLLGIKLGMCLSNFGGSMRLSGPDLRGKVDWYPQNQGEIKVDTDLTTAKWSLPLTFRMGVSTDLVGTEGQLMVSNNHRLTMALDTFDPNDALLRSNAGLEYEWNGVLTLRVGYHGLTLTKDDYNTYNTANYTFGAGLHYHLGKTKFQFDYALTDYIILGNCHHFSLGLVL